MLLRNRSFILNQFNEVKFEIEDYIYFNNYLKDESSKLERLKFNLLYQHNIDLIHIVFQSLLAFFQNSRESQFSL